MGRTDFSLERPSRGSRFRARRSIAWILLAHALVLLALLPTGCERGSQPDRMNVILISIDTLRRDALGFYGQGGDGSPFLDELSKSALVFDAAISQAPWTLPSHAAMLCSLYPSVLDLGSFAKPMRIHDKATTLAEAMKAAGYDTFGIVAGGFLHSELGFDQGFSKYDEGGLNLGIVVNKCLAEIDAKKGDAPFFAFLHTYDVHRYNPSQEDRDQLVTVRDSKLGKLPQKSVAEQLQRNDNAEFLKSLGPRDLRYARELYDASVHSIDRDLKRLFGELQTRHLLDNTLIVITSDHGEEFWEHGRTGHGYNLHDENLRVPLIFVGPKIVPKRIKDQVRLIDLAPTIASLAKVTPAASWLGTDLTPIVDGATRDLPAFSEAAHVPEKSIRFHGYKLVVSLRRPYQQLFDLNQDPHEEHDVLAAQPEIAVKLRALLAGWIKECAADSRFRGAGEVTLSGRANQEIAELGYAAGGASEPASAAPWLRALERDPMEPPSAKRPQK